MRKITPRKRKDLEEGPTIEIYPKFSIELEHFPEAREGDIGEKFLATLELEMTGLNIEKKKEYSNVSFNVKGIEVQKKKKKYKLLYRD